MHLKDATKDKWLEYLILSWDDLIKNPKAVNELGKILQFANEYFQRDRINDQTSLKVVLREEVEEETSSYNQVRQGYDLISENGLRIQSKFRGGKDIHLANTRRNSKKNKGAASKTGHVAYRVDECDAFSFTRHIDNKNKNYEDTAASKVIAIPSADLEDPKNPGFIRTSVPASMEREYEGRMQEILETLEAQKKIQNSS